MKTRRDFRDPDVVRQLKRADAAQSHRRFDDRPARCRLIAVFAYPCGSWSRFCDEDRLYFGSRLRGASGDWRERAE